MPFLHYATGFMIKRGGFDPTSLALSRQWDYHKSSPVPPSCDEVEKALILVGWKNVYRSLGEVMLPVQRMAIDLGGFGKEYAVDKVCEMAMSFGLEGVCVDFGRDIRVAGVARHGGAWRVGIENPGDPGRCWGGVNLRERAIATSGNYLRGFQYDETFFGHVIDVRSGYPSLSQDALLVP